MFGCMIDSRGGWVPGGGRGFLVLVLVLKSSTLFIGFLFFLLLFFFAKSCGNILGDRYGRRVGIAL